MSGLPGGERAVVDARKLTDYVLSPEHPRGRHKARVLREALGIGRAEAAWLRQALLTAAARAEPNLIADDEHGRRWRLDIALEHAGKRAKLRTLWIVRTGEDFPRFVTCWALP